MNKNLQYMIRQSVSTALEFPSKQLTNSFFFFFDTLIYFLNPLIILKGGEQLASSVTQIWYSLRLSGKDQQLVICTLEELIQASNLEELTKGAMKMDQDQFQKVVKVWSTWLDLSSRSEDWITEARRSRFDSTSYDARLE